MSWSEVGYGNSIMDKIKGEQNTSFYSKIDAKKWPEKSESI